MKNKLLPREVLIIQMALTTLVEELGSTSKDVTLPFTPEARRVQKEMLDAARSALAKLSSASGHVVQMDPYQEGDEKEFFTKES